MFELLRLFNEAVGPATLNDIYSLTPREFDTIVAGGLKRSYNDLEDDRFALENTVMPVVMIDPSKFDEGKIKKVLQDQLQSIQAITDKKLQRKIEKKKQQQQRFVDIFMNKKKGGKS